MKNKTALSLVVVWTFLQVVLYVIAGGKTRYLIERGNANPVTNHWKEKDEVFFPFQDFDLWFYDYLELLIYVGVPIIAYVVYRLNSSEVKAQGI